MNVKRRNMKTLLIAILMLLSVTALNLPFPVAANTATDFCTACEDDCYRHSDGVKDYNMCVMLCNYAGNCGIPIIQ